MSTGFDLRSSTYYQGAGFSSVRQFNNQSSLSVNNANSKQQSSIFNFSSKKESSYTTTMSSSSFSASDAPDGVIGQNAQGDIGDCFFLSSLNALNSTQQGKAAIKNMIKPLGNGSYQVSFPGSKKPYTITAADIAACQENGGATGDTDVNILESAADKFAEDNPGYFGTNDDGSPITTITNGGLSDKAISLLTGKDPSVEDERTIDDNNQFVENDPGYAQQVTQDLNKMASDPNGVEGVVGFEVDDNANPLDPNDPNAAGGHAFSITKIDSSKQTVTVHNPWDSDSSKDMTMSYSQFIKESTYVDKENIPASSNNDPTSQTNWQNIGSGKVSTPSFGLTLQTVNQQLHQLLQQLTA